MTFYTLIKVIAAQLLMPLPLCIMLFLFGLALRLRWRQLGSSCSILAVFMLTLLSWSPVADRLLTPFEFGF